MRLEVAKLEHLQSIKEMYREIVADMKLKKLEIWDEVYPCEFLEEDIKKEQLYILLEHEIIVGAFALCVIRQIKRCLFRQIKTGLSEHLTMG